MDVAKFHAIQPGLLSGSSSSIIIAGYVRSTESAPADDRAVVETSQIRVKMQPGLASRLGSEFDFQSFTEPHWD